MSDHLLTILGVILGIIGLVATFIGTYFTYISFINPIKRFGKYLKNSKDWEKFQGIEDHFSCYRYKKYPNFQIVIDWDKVVVENFHEEWIRPYPDKTNNASYHVRLEANSMLLSKELFVSLDGHRYFVPAPKILSTNGNEREFYYDRQQIQLAEIIGSYNFDMNIYEFARNCRIPILIKE